MNDPKRVLIVALGIPLLLMMGFGIKGAIDSGGEKTAHLYNTAVQATDGDHFNYAIDSRQGRLIGQGQFTATQEVKFPEMSKAFGYVEKSKEEYTMHTREDCSTDSDGNEHCTTETYYTWDWAGDEDVSTPALKLYGREYPATLFNLDGYKHDTDACDFTPKDTSGWFSKKNGCDDGYYYTDSDTRYSYDVVDTAFTASLFADVSTGTLKPFNGNQIALQNKDPKQMVKDANDYHLGGTLFIVFWFILVLGGMGALAYQWALSDGLWQ